MFEITEDDRKWEAAVKENRIGTFRVTEDILWKNDGVRVAIVQKVLGENFLIIRAWEEADTRTIAYLAFSPLFAPKVVGIKSVEYAVSVTVNGRLVDVTAKQIDPPERGKAPESLEVRDKIRKVRLNDP